MTNNCGGANLGRRIWWFGWTPFHGYGGKNGHGGIGKREIRSQRVGSKSISIIHSYVINNNNNNKRRRIRRRRRRTY